ncbi:MAG: hypothetical protein KF729_37635 [Sandaracinaceae bacterium]|nr:hypothetical protein [Sandaracinaceae bacterium]
MADEDGASGFFRSFANAMLERSLPAIREWLVSRLGPGTKVGTITLAEGRVVVGDAHVPLGARVVLDVDEAILDARPEDLVAGLPPARLVRLRGALRVMSGGAVTLSAPVEIEGRGAASAAWVDGEVRVGGASWQPARGVGDALPMYGTGRLTITTDAFRIVDASLTSGASQSRLDARGTLGAEGARLVEAVLSTRYARLGHALDVWAAFLGAAPSLPLPIPLDAVVDGTVSRDADGRTKAELTARTDRSELALRAAAKGRALEDAELSGTAAAEELLPAWILAAIDPAASEPLSVRARGHGPLDALDAEVELEAAALGSPWLRAPRAGTARLAVRGGRRWRVEGALEGAGTGQLELAIAPYGTLDGAAQLGLRPEAWALGPFACSGAPVELGVAIGGTRSAPELTLELDGRELTVARGSASVAMRRPRARAKLAGTQGGLRFSDATGEARVGPGSVRLERHGEVTTVRLARVAAPDALAGLALVGAEGWASLDEMRLPPGAQVWAELALEGGGARGTAHLETPRSRVSLDPLVFGGGSFEGTRALAVLDLDDALATGVLDDSPVLPREPGAIELRAEVSGRGEDAAVALDARARRLVLGLGEGRLALDDVRARASLTRATSELHALEARVLGGRLEASGALSRERLTIHALRLAGARPGALASDPRTRAALAALALDLDVAGPFDALRVHATLSSAATRLEATLATDGAALAPGARVEGHVGAADLAPLLAPLALDGAPLAIRAALSGRWARPAIALTLEGGDNTVALGPVRAPLEALRVEARLDDDGLAIDEASARLAGGRVRLAALGSRAFGGALARLTAEGVDLARIERVSRELTGALHLELVAWRLEGGAPGGRAEARVEAPRYLGVARFAELFSRYGLRMPERESSEPLVAGVRLGGGALELRTVEARTASFSVRGAATRSSLGRWRGELALVARQAWLETSHLFEHPARWIGDVRVPIHVEGPEGHLRARADVLAALDEILARTWIGRGLGQAIEALMRALRMAPEEAGASSPARHHAPDALSTADALVDRVAARAPDAEEALEALLTRGLAPRELAERVQRRR